MAELNACSSNFRPEICGVNLTVDPVSQVIDDNQKVLIIGQTDASSTLPLGAPIAIAQGRPAIGLPSNPLAQSVAEFESIAPTADIYVMRVQPLAGASSDVQDVTFTVAAGSTPTAGVAYMWVNGQVFEYNYPAGSTATTIRDEFLTQLQDAQVSSLAITATSQATDQIQITAMTSGNTDGFVDVRTVYGRQPMRITTSDVAITVNQSGTRGGSVDLSALAGVVDGFAFIDNPYVLSDEISAVDAYACSQWAGGANSRYYGLHYGAPIDNVTFSESVNSGLAGYMGLQGALTPPYVESAAFAALAYNQMNCNSAAISASMSGTLMPQTLAPEVADVITDQNIQADMVNSGIGYFTIDRLGRVSIGRAVTTYTVNPQGQRDISLQDINRPSQLACISTDLRTQLTALTTGTAYRQDGVVGTNLSGNAPVVTDAAIRNLLAARAEVLSGNNVIQDVPAFIRSISFTNADGGCISVTVDPTLVDQFCCLNVILRAN